MPVLPAWFPSDTGLAGVLVVLLTVAVAVSGGGGRPTSNDGGGERLSAAVVAEVTTPSTVAPTSTTVPAAPTVTLVADLNRGPAVQNGVGGSDGAILPHYRILSYYGHPNDPKMGILGEHGKSDLLQLLRDEQAAYEAADPTRPVMPAFEVIASVAQNWPTDDNSYLLHTGPQILDSYARFCEKNDLLLILDIQIGHSTVQEEIEQIRPWLELPYVHLAIDPEFAMAEGEVPGREIGGVDAADITYAQQELAEIAAENDLPPKILIVHQFEEGMIRNSEQLTRVADLQLIIEFDGYGDPSNKIAGYNLFVSDQAIDHSGIKLFYRQDAPLLTPREVVGLTPPPDLVIYQ